MAGSYHHIIKKDGSFRGLDLIENLGDAYEAIEEMYDMIEWMSTQIHPKKPKKAIWKAWREGHMRKRHPYNADNESLCSYEAFWHDD